jgi:hypothetical protein
MRPRPNQHLLGPARQSARKLHRRQNERNVLVPLVRGARGYVFSLWSRAATSFSLVDFDPRFNIIHYRYIDRDRNRNRHIKRSIPRLLNPHSISLSTRALKQRAVRRRNSRHRYRCRRPHSRHRRSGVLPLEAETGPRS